MNIVFLGYGGLGLECLQKMLEVDGDDHQVIKVFTHSGEGGLEHYCDQNSIPVSTCKKVELESEFPYDAEDLCLISVNYRYIVSKNILDQVEFGINLHGSLLPKYRGRTPHVWAIINGEKFGGITAHFMDEKVDAGNILVQKNIHIFPDESGGDLLRKYEEAYPEVLKTAFLRACHGDKGVTQDEHKASYFGVRTPIMGCINLFAETQSIHNFVRAQKPPEYPGAYLYSGEGKKLIVKTVLPIDPNSLAEFRDLEVGSVCQWGGRWFASCLDALLELELWHGGEDGG